MTCQDGSHSLEFFAFQLVAGRPGAGEPAVHEREQIPAKLALIGVACEDLLRIGGVHREFTLAGVIARATERTIEPHLPAAAVDFERDAALRRRLLKRCLSLEIIYVHVPWLIHPRTGKRGVMVG